MSNPFNKATKEKAFLRLALIGISGGGKTYSALNIAQHLVPGGKVALIDTEHGSASKYADLFTFDTVDLFDFEPKSYIAMIKAAAANGYDVVIIDSLTHAWDKLLAMKDKEAAKKGQNSFTAWGVVNKHYDSLIEAIVGTPIHIIGTIRSKSDYIMEEYTDRQGKVRTKPVKVGMKAIQRDGFEYEFDVVAQMDIENRFIVEKTRCTVLTGEVVEKPGKEVADVLRAWLSDGVEPVHPPTPEPPPETSGNGKTGSSVPEATAEAPTAPQNGELDAHFGPRKSVVEDMQTDDEFRAANKWTHGNGSEGRMDTVVVSCRGIWQASEQRSIGYIRTYRRIGKMIGSQMSPKNKIEFQAMMRNDCGVSGDALVKVAKLYEPSDMQDANA